MESRQQHLQFFPHTHTWSFSHTKTHTRPTAWEGQNRKEEEREHVWGCEIRTLCTGGERKGEVMYHVTLTSACEEFLWKFLVWFGLCKLSNWLLQTVVDDWLDVYKQDREEGLLELINFVVECSGCKGKSCSITWPDASQQKSASTRIGIHVLLAIVRCIVKYEVMESLIALKLVCWLYCCAVGFVTREMFDVMQNADIISHLTKEFNEVSGDQGLG